MQYRKQGSMRYVQWLGMSDGNCLGQVSLRRAFMERIVLIIGYFP